MGYSMRRVWPIGIVLAISLVVPGFSEDGPMPGFVDQPALSAPGPMGIGPAPPKPETLPAEFAIHDAVCRPAWYFHVEALALKRDASGDQTYATFVERQFTEQGGTFTATDFLTSVLGTGNLEAEFRGGGRALIGRTLGAHCALEVSYFDLTRFDQFAAVRDDTLFVSEVDASGDPSVTFPASLFSPFSDFGDPAIVGLDYNEVATLSFSSRLNNLEWNLRHWILLGPRSLQVSVLVGGRWTNVDETLGYFTESAVPGPGGATNDITTQTDNNMLGVQLGAMFKFHVDRCWWVDCEIKGVAYDNKASQTTVFEHDGVAKFQGRHVGSRAQHVSTFALDLSLTATALITPRLAIRGGYQALWIDNLALASENLSRDADVLLAGPAMLNSDGKVVYHGPHLGITWIW